ncbi:oplophorus-luciferin 2-monooxygenase non-catalytic subunit-like [Panulirus ornatus]|uniref:oplophorus-luciferin 2-monooxygenase non-catalytic subunit-like n=1 Tax=Panulirus ornatus TaxID=150431 RepID=UPI003A8847D1
MSQPSLRSSHHLTMPGYPITTQPKQVTAIPTSFASEPSGHRDTCYDPDLIQQFEEELYALSGRRRRDNRLHCTIVDPKKKRMLKSLLLLVALVSGSRCSPASDNSPKEHRSNWPCPVDVEIRPCVCTTDADFNLYMDCSEVTSADQLATVFSQDFPFPDFQILTIIQLSPFSPLDALPAGVFGIATFQHVVISGTYISTVEEETFSNSHETLLTLDLSNNQLSSFPFESIPLFTHLWKFTLANNYLIDFPNIVSDSIRSLSLAQNTGLSLTETAFNQVRLLEELYLEEMQLGSVPPNMLSHLNHIHTVELSYNGLTGELIENLINPPVRSLRKLHLHNNQIRGIHPLAIVGLDRTATIDFKANEIIKLDKENWRLLLEDIIGENVIDLRDNPLSCGCDVYWLVADRVHMAKIHKDTTCSTGVKLHDLPLSFFQNHCPGGPALW